MARLEVATGPTAKQERKWEVEHALHIVREAAEIVSDKKLMAEVKKLAAERAAEMQNVSEQAAMLSKRGLVSDKAMAKLAGRK